MLQVGHEVRNPLVSLLLSGSPFHSGNALCAHGASTTTELKYNQGIMAQYKW